MDIEVFESKNRTRVGIISVYSYATYAEELNDYGSFVISIPKIAYADILVKNNFVLFDKTVLGIIKYVGVTVNNKDSLQIRGVLLNYLLEQRVVYKTTKYSGTLESICESLVTDNFVSPTDTKRKISFMSVESVVAASTDTVEKSVTGKSVFAAVSTALSTKNYGFSVKPVIVAHDEQSDNPTNIQSAVFKIIHPTDRSIDNSEGNSPVVFSIELSNLKEIFYDMDATKEASIAVVAGEGEGTNRTVVEVGETDSAGFERSEMYVDARDIQDSTTQELTQRGLEYLEDNKEFTSFSCTLLDSMAKHYNDTFFLGDYVSVLESRLGLLVKTQITKVVHSATGSDNIIDIIFGNEKVTWQQLIKKGEF